MGQALYRKYRSKKLSEIVGQEHVTKTLERALKAGKISHAYLFTGPKGVGKTSIARILAHEVNNLPYTDESIHLDIIEIDAASNRRIDEIRDLRDKVHIAPTSAKYKVYIIDEVHMLTKEAFNALLKTLEEPPAHVIFILATTESHKLPETITSRTQRFNFKIIDEDKAVEHLLTIAKEEKIDIDESAVRLLVEHGGGSFRDSISLLDQIGSADRTIKRPDVEKLIGVAPKSLIEDLLKATMEGTTSEVADSLAALVEQGTEPQQIAKQLNSLLRERLLSGNASAKGMTNLMEWLLSVSSAHNPAAALELVLFKANLENSTQEMETTKTSEPKLKKEVKETKEVKVVPTEEVLEKTVEIEQIEGPLETWWPEVLKETKKHNNTLYGVLRIARPSLDGDILNLEFAFGFHAKKIADIKTKGKIESIITSITGQSIAVNPTHNKDARFDPVQENEESTLQKAVDVIMKPTESNQDLQVITSVFGGGEVL